MTKKDLETLRDKHASKAKACFDSYTFNDFNYELGYMDALNFVLENFDELYEETHENELMQRATKKAEFYIRKYFKNKYDREYFAKNIEKFIQQALDKGDAETIANSFIDSADGGIPDDEWCKSIVRDFYD